MQICVRVFAMVLIFLDVSLVQLVVLYEDDASPTGQRLSLESSFRCFLRYQMSCAKIEGKHRSPKGIQREMFGMLAAFGAR